MNTFTFHVDSFPFHHFLHYSFIRQHQHHNKLSYQKMGLRIKPGFKRIGCYTTALVAFYCLFIRQKFEITIAEVDAKIIWEYWADFSNYKTINPTV